MNKGLTKKHLWLYAMGLHETLKLDNRVVFESIDCGYKTHINDLCRWYTSAYWNGHNRYG